MKVKGTCLGLVLPVHQCLVFKDYIYAGIENCTDNLSHFQYPIDLDIYIPHNKIEKIKNNAVILSL